MFPPARNFDIDAGDGGGGGGGDHLGPKNHKRKFVRKMFTPLGFVFRKMSKHIFKISSYIHKKTTNPINAFKNQFIIQNTAKVQNTFKKIQHVRLFSNISKFHIFKNLEFKLISILC